MPDGEEHVERVVERDLLVLQRRVLGQQVGPRRDRDPGVLRRRAVGVEVGQVHQVLQALRGEGGHDLGHLVGARHGLVAVGVAVHRHQHARPDLAEPVDHRLRPELRRHRAEDRPEARAREQHDEGLADVGRVRRHAVAAAHAEPRQAGPAARDVGAQLGRRPGHAVAGLAARDDHDVVVRAPGQGEHRLGVGGAQAREPLGARHRLPRQRHRRRLLGPVVRDGRPGQAQLAPGGQPPAVEVVDRPGPEGLVVREGLAAPLAQGAGQPAEPRVLPVAGLPQDRGCAHAGHASRALR